MGLALLRILHLRRHSVCHRALFERLASAAESNTQLQPRLGRLRAQFTPSMTHRLKSCVFCVQRRCVMELSDRTGRSALVCGRNTPQWLWWWWCAAAVCGRDAVQTESGREGERRVAAVCRLNEMRRVGRELAVQWGAISQRTHTRIHTRGIGLMRLIRFIYCTV